MDDWAAIAERTFSPREVQTLRRLPSVHQIEGFFNCWTRKEAYVKAIGEGLAHPLDRFSVSLAPGVPARLEHVEENPAEAARWELVAVTPAPGFIGAIAVEA
jgi:4'-phosphopantetheinyl transferase